MLQHKARDSDILKLNYFYLFSILYGIFETVFIFVTFPKRIVFDDYRGILEI
jgi:hypothetical protein